MYVNGVDILSLCVILFVNSVDIDRGVHVKKGQGYHHGELGRALLQEALVQVETSGTHALSARAVARAVGVDAAAAYRHYKDKQALLAAVSAQGFEALGQSMVMGLGGAHESLFLRQARAYVSFALARGHLYRLMFGGQVSQSQVDGFLSVDAPNPYALLSVSLDALWRTARCDEALRKGAEFEAWSSLHGAVSLRLGGQVDAVVPDAELGGYVVRGLERSWARR